MAVFSTPRLLMEMRPFPVNQSRFFATTGARPPSTKNTEQESAELEMTFTKAEARITDKAGLQIFICPPENQIRTRIFLRKNLACLSKNVGRQVCCRQHLL